MSQMPEPTVQTYESSDLGFATALTLIPISQQ